MVSAWRVVLLAAASHIVDLQICLLDGVGLGLQQTLCFFRYLVVLQNHIGHVHDCDLAVVFSSRSSWMASGRFPSLPFCCRKSREDEEKEERYCAGSPPLSGCSRTGDWATILFDLSYEESLRKEITASTCSTHFLTLPIKILFKRIDWKGI